MPRFPTDGGDRGAWGSVLIDLLQVILADDGYVQDGTQAAPGLAFSDGTTPDADTGLRRPGANRVTIVTSGIDRWEVGSAGHLFAVTDNLFDIGQSAATRPRDIYAAGGINAGSYFAGTAALRGLATMNSGTTVVSVSAPAVRSGDVILTQMYMFATAQNSGQSIVTNVQSVRAGAFEIVSAGSLAPAANMNLAWFTLR